MRIDRENVTTCFDSGWGGKREHVGTVACLNLSFQKVQAAKESENLKLKLMISGGSRVTQREANPRGA